ncbi:MAG: metallophosphoesterase, partial [Bacteroidota bacterium]
IIITLLLLIIGFIRKIKIIALNKKRKTVLSDSDFKNQRRDFIKMAALGAGAIPFAASVYSFSQGAFRFIVRKQKIYLKNFPVSMNGLRVCQISDIHAGFITNNRKFNEGISILLDQKPQIIFFTGDLVSNDSSEVNDVYEILSRIEAPLGVFSVLGNHDYGEYATWMTDEERKIDVEKMISIQRSMGWKLLMNENAMIDKDIAIVGTENWGDISRFPKKADMTKALANTESASIKLLLTHDPSFWNLKILNHYKEIQMTFSGHTHAFQFGIDMFGKKWSPAQYLYPTWDGLYKKNEQYLYVNRGMGNAGFSGRLGMWPEIAVFDFYRL